MRRLVKTAAYGELCDEVGLAELLTHGNDALAMISAECDHTPPAPLDLSGMLNAADIAQPAQAATGFTANAESWWTAPFHQPALYGAVLHDALLVGGRLRGVENGRHRFGHLLLAQGGQYVVPDSYHVRGRARSLSDLLTPCGEAGDAWRLELDESIGEVPGTTYFAGALFGAFGHFLTEGLARLWLWRELEEPDVPIAIYDQAGVHDWQLGMLGALGIAPERLMPVMSPTRFERLIVPSRAYVLHEASSPAQDETWQRIGDHFDDGRAPGRVYLSRSKHPVNRKLENEAAVEEIFAERGFAIVHSQKLPIGEQIATVRGAEWLAGSAGSQMYLAGFQPRGAQKLIVSPRRFTFRDDQLIGYFRGEPRAQYFLTDDQDSGGPRTADYRVDLPALASAVDHWLRARPAPAPGARKRATTAPHPIFVGGTGRSGTTIAGALIASHPRYAGVPFELRVHAFTRGLSNGSRDVEWMTEQSWARFDQNLHRIVSRETFEALLHAYTGAPAHDAEAARAFIEGLMVPVAAAQGRPSWVDMTPVNSMMGSWLHEIFPEMRMVHLFRDGRDVAASTSKSWGRMTISEALDFWGKRIEKIGRDQRRVPTMPTLLVRFEDLARDDREGAFVALCDFLEVDEMPEMREFFETRLRPEKANIGRWNRDLTGDEQEAINEQYRATLTRLRGIGVDWVDDPESVA